MLTAGVVISVGDTSNDDVDSVSVGKSVDISPVLCILEVVDVMLDPVPTVASKVKQTYSFAYIS